MSEKRSEDLIQADTARSDSSEKFTRAAEWLPISTCPLNSAHFDAWQILKDKGGKASGVRVTDIRWSLSAQAFVNVRGEKVEYIYEDSALFLSHWMPLPAPPNGQVNFSDEAGSDQVGLNQTFTSESNDGS